MPSGAALRSGRNTRKCTASPRNAAIANARISDAVIGQPPSLSRVMRTGTFNESVGRKSSHGRNSSPRFQAVSKVNIPYIAIAPWAKLITPDPL